MDTVNVFISSTWIDMIPERAAVEQATHRLRSVRFVGMEHFGARNGTPRYESLDEVDRCQVYVCVLGHRWGSGITEAEYRRAIERGLPCLIYRKAGTPAADEQPAADVERLTAWQRELEARHTILVFENPEQLATRVVADLHNLVFDRLVVEGIGRLHSDYHARIQRFLAEYLGTREAPVPFGGRSVELDHLDRWLANSRAPPYAFVGGPAGRGKSALLAHWVRSLGAQEDLSLIYYPISIRFRTNLASVAFASLTARLAALHGEPVLAGPETPAEVWRELMAAYLRRPVPEGRRFLVVLDGADESADWQPGPDLFPATPPPGLRVLVSARYLAGDVDTRGWLTRLGWDRPRAAYAVDLAPLTPQGLVDVLRQTSIPLDALSARADVVAELFRLSVGDPLLINLYISDLMARGETVAHLQPEELASLQPGLEGYFRRWWEDQRTLWGEESPLKEPAVNSVLNLLACALGPLRTAEILELMPEGQGVPLWAFEDVISGLRRFIVGDGDVQGYAFSHPRLGDYFYERLAKAAREREQEMRFVAWGRRCLEELRAGQRKAAEVPHYLLHFLRPHFERAGCGAASYVDLASNAWAMAWERVDKGSYSGFLADLRRVQDIAAAEDNAHAARGETLPFIATELRAALSTISIASQAAQMSVELFQVLTARDIWTPTQAIAYAARIPDARGRLHSMIALVAFTPASDRPLALAAGATELRNVLTQEEGPALVRDLIHDIAKTASRPTGPGLAAEMFEAISRLARQGLSVQQRDQVLTWLEETASLDGSGESGVMLLTRLHDSLDGPSRDFTDRCVGELRRFTETMSSPSSHAGERLMLLRRALKFHGETDATSWTDAALRAAAEVASAAAATSGGLPDPVLVLLERAWGVLSPNVVRESQRMVLPTLTAVQLDALVERCTRRPIFGRETLDLLPATHRERFASLLPQHESEREEIQAREALRRAFDLEGHPSDPWIGPIVAGLTADDAVSVCATYVGSGRKEALAVLLLAIVERFSAFESRVEAMAALLDTVQPPGFGDSLEAWRTQAMGDPGSIRAVQLRVALALMLRRVGASPRAVWTTVLRLSQMPPFTESGAAYVGFRHRLAHVAKLPDIASTAAQVTAIDKQAVLLATRVASENLSADAITTIVLEDRARSISDVLSLLADVAEQVSGPARDNVRGAVAFVLGEEIAWSVGDQAAALARLGAMVRVPALVARGALWPPTPETLNALGRISNELWSRDVPASQDVPGSEDDLEAAMVAVAGLGPDTPDLVRQALLAVALRQNGDYGWRDKVLAQLPLALARLAQPSEDLVAMGLTALHTWNFVLDRDVLLALELLIPHLSRNLLPRWLGVISGRPLDEIGRLLAALRAYARDADAYEEQLIDAVGQIPTPRERARWIVVLTMELHALDGETVWRRALPLARGLPDARERLTTLCAVIPSLPRTRRGEALMDALKLAPQFDDTNEISRTLVQLAVDAGLDDAAVHEVAVAAAIKITDRGLRSEALVALAEVLPPKHMAAAVAASRQLDDAAARVRAMRALAEAAPQWSVVSDQICDAIEALPAGATRDAALLFASPCISPVRRWNMVAAALCEPPSRGTGFDDSEMLDALQQALCDAPAFVMTAAIRWIGQLPASGPRSRTLCNLMPGLPTGLRLPALVLISAWTNTGVLAQLCVEWPLSEIQEALRSTVPIETRDLLQRIATMHQALPELDPWEPALKTHDDIRQQLRVASDDLNRLRVVRWAARAELAPPMQLQLVEVARAIGDAVLRHTAARHLAVFAPDDALSRAVDAAAGIDDAAERAVALARLAARHTGRARDKVLDLALEALAAEKDLERRLAAACECAAKAPLRYAAALEIIGRAHEVGLRERMLGELLSRLPDGALMQVVAAANRLLPEERRGPQMIHLASAGGPLTASAVPPLAASLRSAVARARVLTAWLPRLDERARPAVVALMDEIDTDFAWLELLGAAVKRWPVEFTVARAERAAIALESMNDEHFVSRWLQAAASAWPATAWPTFTRAVANMRDDAERFAALRAAIGACAGEVASEVLIAARELQDGRFRAMLLGEVALCRTPFDAFLLEEALTEAARLGDPALRIDTMNGMAESTAALPSPLLGALFGEFDAQPLLVLQALHDLAPKLGCEQALELLPKLRCERLHSARAECADLLFALAPVVGQDLASLIEAIPAICGEREGSLLLRDLKPCIVDDASQAAALAVALSFRAPSARAEALLGIATCLNPARQSQLVDALVDTPLEAERARRLTEVQPLLTADVQPHWREVAERLEVPELKAALLSTALTAKDERSLASAVQSAREETALAGQAVQKLLDELPPTRSRGDARDLMAVRSVTQGDVQRVDGFWPRVTRMECEDDRYDALNGALLVLPAEERLYALQKMDQVLQPLRYDRMLLEIARALPMEKRQALIPLLQRVADPTRLKPLLAGLPVDYWPSRTRQALLDAVRKELEGAAQTDRSAMLAVLDAWAPVVVLLGGDSVCAETIAAIDDVGRLWP